jgi:Bacterial CdiA-CT RNAse A domain
MKILKLNRFVKLFLAVFLTAISFYSCQSDDINFNQNATQSVDPKEESNVSISQRVGDFLTQQENLGGHTLERHVGKTTAFLQNRLNTSSISAASTYSTITSAEGAILNGINANRTAITNWSNNSTSRYTINYTNSVNVGVVLNRGASSPVASRRIIVVLQKKASAPNGYYVLTSYPN